MIDTVSNNGINFKQQHNKKKYKDPLNSNAAVLMSYSNEIGTVISEIAPKLGTALWVPTFMYLGADIYDKYKNDKDNYNPSAKRALNRAIFQGITCLVALPAVIFAGQKVTSPLGRLDKSGISVNAKNSIYRHTRRVIDQAHSNALENYEQFKEVILKTMKNKISARRNEKETSGIFKKLYRNLFTHRYDILSGDEKKMFEFAEKNAKKTYDIAQALQYGEISAVPMPVYRKYKNVLPVMKETYKDGDYSFQATRTALKEYQQEMIFKNQILKTIGGLLTLIVFAKPVNDYVDKHIMIKYIEPGVDQLNSSAFKKFTVSNFFNKNSQGDTPEEENSQKLESKILQQKTAPLS